MRFVLGPQYIFASLRCFNGFLGAKLTEHDYQAPSRFNKSFIWGLSVRSYECVLNQITDALLFSRLK